MSKDIVKKSTRPLNPKSGPGRSRSELPLEQAGLDEQQERPKQSADSTPDALKTPTRPVRVEFSSTSPKAPTPVQPPAAPAPREANLSHGAASQKPAQTAAAPKPSAVATSATPKAGPLAPPTQPTPAQKATAPKTISVNFTLLKPDAKQVWVSGDFNGWSHNATAMKRRNDGRWETTVALAPGRYQYKFLVDGQWIADPTAKQNVANPFGSLNSVLEVQGH